jgi:TonB family protein
MLLLMYESSIGRGIFRIFTVTSLSLVIWAPATRAQEQAPRASSGKAVQERNSSQIAELLTSTNGVDFSGYIGKEMATVKKNWIATMPPAVWAGAKGKTIVEFQIQSDGKIENISLRASSGTDSLDQAAIQGVRNSSPLDHLPLGFSGAFVVLRLSLSYNQGWNAAVQSSAFACSTPASDTAQTPPFDRLELLAFLTSGGYSPYATQVICQRGISFTLDSGFLTTLHYYGVAAGFLDSLAKITPRTTLEASPDRANAYGLVDLAVSHKKHGQLQLADDDLARAIKLAPDSATLHLAYARNLIADHNYSEAEAQSRRSVELWPEDAEAHVSLATALTMQNRDSEAVPEAREALRISPGDKAARVELGISLARSGQYKEAIPVLRDVKFMAPQLPVIYKHLAGSLVHAGGDFDEAIQYLNLFLKSKPDDAEAHYLLGVALRGAYKPDEALAEFREAARLAPSNPVYSVILDPMDAKDKAPDASNPHAARPDDGFVSVNLYTNRFFGFSYEFPKGWNVLEAERGKAIVRLGASILANGDPTTQDIAEASADNAYQLLLVSKQTTKDISTNISSIQIQAISTQFGPQLKSGSEFLKAAILFLQRRGTANPNVGTPEQFAADGRTFWKVKLDFPVNNVVSHVVEAVTIEKGYFIEFVFASPDTSKLDQLQATMNSIRFVDPTH